MKLVTERGVNLGKDMGWDLEVSWKYTVKRDLYRGCFTIGRMEVRNIGEQAFPAGRQGMIKAWRVSSNGTPEGKEAVLVDTCPLPAIPAGQMAPIASFSAPLFEDMKVSQDNWQFAFYVRGVDGKPDLQIYRSDPQKITDLPRVDDLEKELASLKKKLGDAKATHHSLRVDLEDSIRTLNSQLREKERKLSVAEDKLRKGNKEYNNLTDECRKLREDMAQLESEREKQLERLEKLENEKVVLGQDKEQLQKSLESAERKLGTSKTQLKTEQNNHQKAVDVLNGEMDSLKAEISQLRDQLESEREKQLKCLEKLENEKVVLGQDKEQFQKSLESAEQRLSDSEKQVSRIMTQLETEQNKKEAAPELIEHLKRLGHEKVVLEKDKEQFQKSLESAEQRLSDSEKLLGSIATQLETEQNKKIEAHGLIEHLKKLGHEKVVLEKDKEQFQKSLELAEQKISDSEKLLGSIAIQLETEQNKHQKAVDVLNDEVDRLKAEISQLPDHPDRITGKDGAEMVLIPAGEFEMGSDDGRDNEKPAHKMYRDAFYMDVYPVTNAQYKKFIDANPDWRKDQIGEKYHNRNYLRVWNGDNYPRGKGDHPVVYVSWYAANAYAEWAGKRLPTGAEWEKAARGGPVGKKHPWGDSIAKKNANYKDKGTKQVGSYPANGYGLYDMVGNGWEWCSDWHDRNYYSNLPRNNPIVQTSSGIWRVLRVGSCYFTEFFLRCALRHFFNPTLNKGFRCSK